MFYVYNVFLHKGKWRTHITGLPRLAGVMPNMLAILSFIKFYKNNVFYILLLYGLERESIVLYVNTMEFVKRLLILAIFASCAYVFANTPASPTVFFNKGEYCKNKEV